MGINKFSEQTVVAIGYYVYALCNSKNEIIYIGKGIGNRVFDSAEKRKLENDNVIPYILYHGLDEKTAFACETALINTLCFIGVKLINIQPGRNNNGGCMSVDEINNFYSEDSLSIEDFNVNDKIMLWNIPPHNQKLIREYKDNWINVAKYFIKRYKILTTKNRDLPKHIGFVYRSILKVIIKVDTKLVVQSKTNKRGQSKNYHYIEVTSIQETNQFSDIIGSSLDIVGFKPNSSNQTKKFTYDKRKV